MIPLVDGDILLYECGFAAETHWKKKLKEAGVVTEDPPPFEYAWGALERVLKGIQDDVETEQTPILLFTGDTNFRNEIAVTKPYKDRPGRRPFHYYNLKGVLKDTYQFFEREGLEADDLGAMMLTKFPDKYIACTRDKDWRQVPGWHYGWEVHNQPSFGPMLIDEMGFLEMKTGKTKGIIGGGLKFFYSQLITGDTVDTIPGIPKAGPVTAFDALKDCASEIEMFNNVKELYKEAYGDIHEEVMLEQGRLLWMTRKLHEDGSPILWEFPK